MNLKEIGPCLWELMRVCVQAYSDKHVCLRLLGVLELD